MKACDHVATLPMDKPEKPPQRARPTKHSPAPVPIGLFSYGGQTFTLDIVPGQAQAVGDAASPVLANFSWEGKTLCVRLVPSATEDPLVSVLTHRERQVVSELAKGMRNKQIAWHLQLSEFTVAAYVKQMCLKLQVHNRTALVSRCVELRQRSHWEGVEAPRAPQGQGPDGPQRGRVS